MEKRDIPMTKDHMNDHTNASSQEPSPHTRGSFLDLLECVFQPWPFIKPSKCGAVISFWKLVFSLYFFPLFFSHSNGLHSKSQDVYFYHHFFGWINKWIGHTVKDIRDTKARTQKKLDAVHKSPRGASSCSCLHGPPGPVVRPHEGPEKDYWHNQGHYSYNASQKNKSSH